MNNVLCVSFLKFFKSENNVVYIKKHQNFFLFENKHNSSKIDFNSSSTYLLIRIRNYIKSDFFIIQYLNYFDHFFKFFIFIRHITIHRFVVKRVKKDIDDI
jgi:hypothetical protein